MATTEGSIVAGTTGKLLDTTIVEQDSGLDTHREAVVLTDPEDNDARANVLLKDHKYASNVYSVDATRTNQLLGEVLKELQISNAYNAIIYGDKLTEDDLL